MLRLNETGQALRQLRPQEPYTAGLHMGNQLTVDALGVKVGETQLDPSMHELSAMDPLSLMGRIRRRPYVADIAPFRPLETNVIVHREPLEFDDPDMAELMWGVKRELATDLTEALVNSKQMADGGTVYVVGDTGIQDGPRNATYIHGTEEPEAAAQAVSDLLGRRSRAVNFIVSCFEALPLVDEGNRGIFTRSVAIKTNHKSELEIPSNIGDYPLDGLETVDTHNPAKLKAANEAIAKRHQQLERQLSARPKLGGLGMAVARVVYQDSYSPRLQTRATDRSIANAIRKLTRR